MKRPLHGASGRGAEIERLARGASREALVEGYLADGGDAAKRRAVGFLSRYAAAHALGRVVSLGAGPCVLEHLLARSAPAGCRVFATDRDGPMVEAARRHFPELSVFRHDFAAEGVPALVERMGGAADLAVFFGSSYVLDDGPFVSLFAALRSAGTRRVVDFQSGVLSLWACLRRWGPLERLRESPPLRRALGRPPLGSFHGYQRSPGSLRPLYRKAGFRVREEKGLGYPFTAVCEAA